MKIILTALGCLIAFTSQSIAHVIVRADRLSEDFQRSSNAIFSLDREAIEQRAQTTLSGLLTTVPGIQVIQQGPSGGQASVFLRGHDPRHLLVLIDGVIVNDPSNPSSQFDFGHLNTALIERIEILKGPQALLYGAGSLAGVLSITTLQNKDQQLIALAVGSFDQTKATVQIKSGSIDLGLHHHRQKGFSAAKPQANTPSTKDGRELLEATLGAALDLGAFGKAQLQAGIQRDHFDIDGFNNQGQFVDKPLDNIRSLEYRFNLSQEQKYLADRLVQRLKLSRFALKRETFANDSNRVFKAQSYQLSSENQFFWNDLNLSLFGVDTRFEQAKIPLEYRQKSFSPFVIQRYEGESFFAMSGLRLNIEEYESNFLSGQFSLGSRARYATTTITLGSGHQSPSLFQRFDPLYGNATLKREESYSLDLNLKTNSELHNKIDFEISLFQSNLKDRFDFDPVSFRTINNDRARIQGFETTLNWNPLKELSFSIDYTNQLARDLKDNKILARRARELVSLRTLVKPHHQMTIIVSQQYVGARQEANGERLSSYLIHAIDWRYAVKESISINLKLENIFNKDYEQIKNYQTPKRNALLEVRWIY